MSGIIILAISSWPAACGGHYGGVVGHASELTDGLTP